MTDRPPLPPFDRQNALAKVQAAEDAWNTRDPGAWREHGLMRRREASINDVPIEASQRRIFGPRPAAERGAEFPIQ